MSNPLIVSDPAVMMGKAVIAGTRVPVPENYLAAIRTLQGSLPMRSS